MLKKLTILLGTILLLSLVACDDDSSSGEPLGAPCTAETTCEGVCNLGLPDGMCVVECSDTLPCEEGTCQAFTDTASYCVPSCTSNDECREGYSCVADVCRPLVPLGGSCEEVADCLPCDGQTDCPEGATVDCNEDICSFACMDSSECPDGTYCADSNGEYWCVAYDFEYGENTYGESCSSGSCADGFICLEQGADDILSICTKSCAVDRDCPPNMRCGDPGDGTNYCLPRENCDACDMDSQCGYQTDKCVTADPAVADGETYCSVTCDPDRSGTCPLDYTCLEAFFCEDLNKWVADCSWCPTGTCEAAANATHQCFKDFGSCTGNGNLCEPCKDSDDCTVEGGSCLSLEGMNNTVCTMPCDSSPNGCPDNYMCVDGGADGNQCIPRTGSCTEPSGGKGTCRTCEQWADCITGGCLPLSGDFDDPTYCLDYCNTTADCGPYAECVSLALVGYNTSLDVCLPNAAVDTCTHWRNCDEDCPDPSQTCSFAYCVEN